MVRQNKKLKYGFVYAKTLYPETKQQNRQIRIGSKAYDRLVNTKSKSIKRNTVEFKRRNAYKKFLPTFYETPNLRSARPLIRNKYIFTQQEKDLLFRSLQFELNKPNAPSRTVEYRFNDEKKFSDTKHTAFKGEYLRELTDSLASGGVVNELNTPGSDTMASYHIRGIADFRIVPVKKTGNMFKSKSGKYFPYINTTNIDLSRYQIYTNKEINIKQQHCVLHTLKVCGIDMSLISQISTNFDNNEYFAKKNFHMVSGIINKQIVLKTYDGKRFQTYKFGDKNKQVINLGLFKEHYFIDEQTDISSYASLHYNEIKEQSQWNHIVRRMRNKYVTDKNKYKVSSITLISNLLKTNNFTDAPMNVNNTYDTTKDDHLYNTLDNEQKTYKHTEYKNRRDRTFYYAHVATDITSTTHTPIMIGIAGSRHLSSVDRVHVIKKGNTDPDCDKLYRSFLDYITRTKPKDTDAIVYMHNLKYAYNTLRKYIYKHQGTPLEKDGMLYCFKVRHQGQTIEFRDSHKIIPFDLCEFHDSFNLPDKYKNKYISSTYYNLQNLNTYSVKLSEYVKHSPINDIEEFKKTLNSKSIIFDYYKSGNDYRFNPLNYYEYYIQYQVYTLYLGIKTQKESTKIITDNKIDLTDCLTVATLSDKYMKVKGSYDGVCSLSGNLRKFVSNAVTGGRVQVNPLYKKKVINKRISAIDARALYASAIERMCKEYGLPTGKCQRINVYTKEELDEYKYYIVKVVITKINKHQQLPMVSYKNKKGLLQYTNKIVKPLEVVIDMITLQDWIEFQGIEYKILDGFYWNNTYNKKMGDVVNEIYNDRLKYSDEGKDQLADVAKLMSNSTYGKMIKKKTSHSYRIVSEKQRDACIETYFSLMESCERLPNGETKLKLSKYDSSSNYAHIGVFVLSYSKRIMNELFDIANTHNCPIYYTDTDSLHCNTDDLNTIENEYFNKYGKDLLGRQLGQYHTDFKLRGSVGEIYATRSIYLGKKSYMNILESINVKGEIITGIKFRMKGIVDVALQHHANIHYNGDLFKLYEELAKGISMTITLNPKNVKVMFEYKNNAINTRADGSFTRTIKF